MKVEKSSNTNKSAASRSARDTAGKVSGSVRSAASSKAKVADKKPQEPKDVFDVSSELKSLKAGESITLPSVNFDAWAADDTPKPYSGPVDLPANFGDTTPKPYSGPVDLPANFGDTTPKPYSGPVDLPADFGGATFEPYIGPVNLRALFQ